MKTAKKGTLASTVVSDLRKSIKLGKYKSGDKICEKKIASDHNVSHIPVREAFRILEGEGLITYRNYSGYIVKKYSPVEIMEIFTLIRILNNEILPKAIPRYSILTFHQLKTSLNELKVLKDKEKFCEEILKLVQILYKPSGLEFMYPLFVDMINKLLHYLNDYYEHPDFTIETDKFIAIISSQNVNEICEFTNSIFESINLFFLKNTSFKN